MVLSGVSVQCISAVCNAPGFLLFFSPLLYLFACYAPSNEVI